MLKLVFVAPKFRLRRVQKNGKKEQKMKNRVLQKTLFYFCVFTSWTLFWRSIRIGNIVWGRCARRNFFFTFCRHKGAKFWKFPHILIISQEHLTVLSKQEFTIRTYIRNIINNSVSLTKNL